MVFSQLLVEIEIEVHRKKVEEKLRKLSKQKNNSNLLSSSNQIECNYPLIAIFNAWCLMEVFKTIHIIINRTDVCKTRIFKWIWIRIIDSIGLTTREVFFFK